MPFCKRQKREGDGVAGLLLYKVCFELGRKPLFDDCHNRPANQIAKYSIGVGVLLAIIMLISKSYSARRLHYRATQTTGSFNVFSHWNALLSVRTFKFLPKMLQQNEVVTLFCGSRCTLALVSKAYDQSTKQAAQLSAWPPAKVFYRSQSRLHCSRRWTALYKTGTPRWSYWQILLWS